MFFINNSNIKNVEFVDLIFDGINLSDLGFASVMQSKNYKRELMPSFTNQIVDMPGKDGSYFLGASLKTGDLQFNLFTDGATSKQMNDLKRLLQPGKLATLSLSESPYLYVYAALEAAPSFDFVPFDYYIYNNNGVITYSSIKINSNYLPITIYKGSTNLNFIIPNPIGYSNYYQVDDSGQGWVAPNWLVDSNIPTKTLLSTYTGFAPNGFIDNGVYTEDGDLDEIGPTEKVPVLNSGNSTALAILEFSFFPGSMSGGYWTYDKTTWEQPIVITFGNVTTQESFIGNLMKVRAFADIEYAVDLIETYFAGDIWNSEFGQTNVLAELEENLHSKSILQQLITEVIENTGPTSLYTTAAESILVLKRLIAEPCVFNIDSITHQITMITSLNDGGTDYIEDVSDSFTGEYPKIPAHSGNWYFNDIQTAKVPYLLITTQDGNTNLSNIKLDYKYTYK